jgi:hypothetical protein
MRKWTALSVCVAFFLVMTTALVIRASRTAVQPIKVEPASRFMPGQPRPKDSFCDWHHAWGDFQYCNEHPSTDTGLTFAFDRRRKTITYSSTYGFGLSIGELMLGWGQPSGYRSTGWAVQVYWGSRSAYLVSQKFEPQARVIFIAYELEPKESVSWKGFVTEAGVRR